MSLEFTNYDLHDQIGVGALGAVHLGIGKKDDRRVAIRIVHPELTETPEIRERFSKLMRNVSTLHHLGLCRVLEFGEVQDHLAVVMELIEGKTVFQLLGSLSQPLPHTRALHVAREILKVITYTHSKGLVHGDLSPGNVFHLEQGDVRVADLGVARALEYAHRYTPRFRAGLLCYVAPECLGGEVPDPASDVYSIGMILYKMLAGAMPRALDEITQPEVVRMVVGRRLPPLREVNDRIPVWLQDIVATAVHPDPARRIGSCEQLLDSL